MEPPMPIQTRYLFSAAMDVAPAPPPPPRGVWAGCGSRAAPPLPPPPAGAWAGGGAKG